MAAFAELATELQEQIVANLDTKDLSAFSRTCTYLHNANLPFLYRHISITWTRDEPSPVAGLALRSLLENEQLALLVRQLHLHARRASKWSGEFIPDNAPEIRSSADYPILRSGLRSLLHEFRAPGLRSWASDAADSTFDVVVALVILRCTNLQWLDVDAGLLAGNKAVPIALRHWYKNSIATGREGASVKGLQADAMTVVPGHDLSESRGSAQEESHRVSSSATHLITKVQADAYRALKRVDIASFGSDRGPYYGWQLHVRVLLMCLRFPAVEELRVHHLSPSFKRDSDGRAIVDEGWNELSEEDAELQHAVQLRTLRLIGCSIGTPGLRRILSLTPKITRLEYDYYAEGYEYHKSHLEWSRYGTLNGEKLRGALDCVRQTLQYLTVTITPIQEHEYVCWISRERCVLHDFPSLRELSLPLPVLCGDSQMGLPLPLLAELLPKSLEVLSFTDTEVEMYYTYETRDLLEMLEIFVTSCHETTPRLRLLKLEVLDEDSMYYWTDEESKRVTELCRNAGVASEITVRTTLGGKETRIKYHELLG